jgi:hypothetical protein
MGKNVSFKLWGVGIKDHPEGGNTAQQVLESSERPEGADRENLAHGGTFGNLFFGNSEFAVI